jgi:hypothetical protein
MTEHDTRMRLRTWIASKRGIAPDQITDTLPILDQRILSSLHVAELLVYIAELRGEPIDVEALRPGVFRDLDSIYRAFFAGRGDGG